MELKDWKDKERIVELSVIIHGIKTNKNGIVNGARFTFTKLLGYERELFLLVDKKAKKAAKEWEKLNGK